MKILYDSPSQIITVNAGGKKYKRGKELSKVDLLENHSIFVENGKIKDLVPSSSTHKIKYDKKIDLSGSIVLPGLVECHTHSAFYGSRSNEFLMRLNGATYEEIAASGGGIISTMKNVRNASFEELVKFLEPKIKSFISQGVTSLEIKSGYGLSFYDEIKLLQVINYFKNTALINIIPTFLGAHTYPPEYKNEKNKYLDLLTEELFPYISQNKLANFVDAFIEKGAFSVEDVNLIFERAKKHKFNLRLHTDQFSSIGGIPLAIKHNCLSADHLEVINDDDIKLISKSKTAAVLLPGVSFFLEHKYAPARELIDNNAIIALSTDYNPGSSHINNLQLIMQLAALKLRMSAEEIISAVTINSAYALGISENTGTIELGKDADFAIFELNEYSELIYNIGVNLLKYTVKSGNIIYQKAD
jgi:imidazolonepropionase